MDKNFNYSILFEQALSGIKSIRDPHSTRPETADLRWNDVAGQVAFDFVDSDLRKYHNVSESANTISLSCLCFMIMQLFKEYDYPAQEIKVEDTEGLAKAHLYVLDKKSNTLLLFKELEECAFWKVKGKEPENVQRIMRDCGADSCKYVYFVMDNAYIQIIGHNEDENDPGRGYNVYSLRWFFEEYFGVEEYACFNEALKKYKQDVKECIGYITVKTLTPGSLINFRKVTENEISKFNYESLLSIRVKNYDLESEEFEKIRKQFFTMKSLDK